MSGKEVSLKKNFIMNAALGMSAFIFPLVTAPYVFRVLGPEGNGRAFYAAIFAAVFLLSHFRIKLELFFITSLTILFSCIGMEGLFKGLEKYRYITIRSLSGNEYCGILLAGRESLVTEITGQILRKIGIGKERR